MTFLDTLRLWDEAVTCADRKDFTEALRVLLSIKEPNSKICFDIGSLHLLKQNLDKAEEAFDCSISKDEHLAVAFFQRGNIFYKKKRYEESLGDFQHAFKALRGNQLIDYKALGLRYKLYACEVLHNTALAEAQLGHWEKAQEKLIKALDFKTDAKLGLLDKALEHILKQKIFKPVELPSNALFRPNKHHVAELDKKDFLGKAKVVSSVTPQDQFSGFNPLKPQVQDGPAQPKEPEVLRTLQGEPHTVLYEFVPETSNELAVVPGNIVFVLQKGSDNWASVVFNERRGIVPYNYLERLEISLDSKQRQEITEPPSGKPPTRPGRKVPEVPSVDPKPKVAQPDKSWIITIHYTFNFAISVLPGSSYATLMEKISKKLNVSSTLITLSLTSDANGQSAINAATEMETVWSRVSGGRIALWCNTEEEEEEPQAEMNFVALHSYESSNPEDLSFNEGDAITLLSKVNEDWLEGRCNGRTGIFPASFVEELTVEDPQ